MSEFDFLPVNEPKDLWHEKVWKPSINEERYIRVDLAFSNGIEFAARLRFLFGGINLGIEADENARNPDMLKSLAAAAPVLLPAAPGPGAHEDYFPLAQIHRFLSMREPSRVVRNVLLRLAQDPENREGLDFVNHVLTRYFQTELHGMRFDESRDLEVRAPLQGTNLEYSLDVVSAGSGLNQILMLAAVLAWRRPGLVLLDEPDAHLHSSVQAQLLDFLYDLSGEFNIQVIAATHSRDLISRAPLQAIVPIDRERTEIQPLQSLEHLLLEYERHGAVSNVDLALLYQTRRCAFVEGETDVELLPRIAERLGYDLFVGATQVVLFDIEGVGKVRLLPELVRLFERLIGAELSWAVVRDNDANVPELREAMLAEADELGFPTFHQWSRYSIENYLLEPPLLLAAIHRRDPNSALGDVDVIALLDRAADEVADDAGGAFVTHAQFGYRDLLKDEQWHHTGGAAATRFLRTLTTLEQKVSAYPGRRIFGRFVYHLQQEHGTQLRLEDVVSVLSADNAPEELHQCFRRLGAIGKQHELRPQ